MSENKITLNTLLPLGMVITLGAAIWWAADQTAQVRYITTSNIEIKQELALMKQDIAAIRESVNIRSSASSFNYEPRTTP